jgi:hypothetical protein
MSTEEIQDLTDRVYLLREYLEAGRIKVAAHLWDGLEESMRRVRVGADGLVVPETVDGQIRALTNGLRYFRYRDDAKKSISLSRIQEGYFRMLENNFGEIRKQMLRAGADPSAAGHVMARNPDFVAHFTDVMPELISDLTEFWRAVRDAGLFHIEDLSGLKGVFGGDLFPSYTRNISSTASIYLDTIILPCPILHSARLMQMWKPEKAAYYVVKHAVNALTYRDLALAEVDTPIVVVLPDLDVLDASEEDSIRAFSRNAALRHGSALFDIQFSSLDELTAFLEKLHKPEELLTRLKRPDRLVFDIEWAGTKKDQVARYLAENADMYDGHFAEGHAGRAILAHTIGRMSQAAAIELRSARLRGTPLIDAETSWRHLTWKMEYDARPSAETDHQAEAMHIVRALQAEGDLNLAWLGNVPPETIIELRRRAQMEEVRALLSRGIPKLIEANPANFFRTSDQVVENLDEAFRAHQRSLLEARDKKLKLYGIDVSACLALGGISVAAAITASPALGAIAGGLGIAGLPNLRDIKTKFRELQEKEQKIRTSPTGLLFKHLN